MANVTLKQYHIIITFLWNFNIYNIKTLYKLTFILFFIIYNYLKKLKVGYFLNPLP